MHRIPFRELVINPLSGFGVGLRITGPLYRYFVHLPRLGKSFSTKLCPSESITPGLKLGDLPSSVPDFVERHEAHNRRQLTLRLV